MEVFLCQGRIPHQFVYYIVTETQVVEWKQCQSQKKSVNLE